MNLISPTRSSGPLFLRHYYNALRDVEEWSSSDPHRLLSLRCSGLPFCPLSFFVNIAYKGMSRSLDMSGLFYTQVGTAVHTAMQIALARNDHRLFGNWLCRKCGTIERFSTQRECCDRPMQYEEIDIDYKGIKGHVDTLFALDAVAAEKLSKLRSEKKRLKAAQKLKFAVVDYKTTSEKAKAAKSRSPGAAYKEQIMAYAYLLIKQYGLQITEVMLCFIPRDNPRNPVLFTQAVTKANLSVIRDSLRIYKQAHKQVLRATDKTDVIDLFKEYGKCKNAFCDVCRKTKDVRTLLKSAWLNAKKADRLPLKTFIQSNMSPG